MRVDSLQSGMVKWVLEKVTEYSDEEVSSDSVISLLLSQFRWLDFVADASSLVSGLLEILSVVFGTVCECRSVRSQCRRRF